MALLGGLLAAQWFPWPSPDESAQEVADYYGEHTDGIRVAALGLNLGGALFAPFLAVIGFQMYRIKGRPTAFLFTYLLSAAACVVLVLVPGLFWQAAAFRPDADPAVIQGLHDAGWLTFVVPIFPFSLTFLVLGLAILGDERDEPIFPRWSGYLSIWLAVLLIPSLLAVFFKHGAFAWHGALTLYLAVTAFAVFMVAMIILLRRAIAREELDSARA